jgi:aryl-alcohol dehydrogenase-like predicted oxidoreductase
MLATAPASAPRHTGASVQQRALGSAGLSVSVVSLGCNNFGARVDAPQAMRVVDAAFDAGINFFDTADVYGGGESERILGAALRGRRDRAVVATKFGQKQGIEDPRPGGSREYMRDRVELSLRRLGTDYVDLLYYHGADGVTPVAETVGYMAQLVEEGKARAIGCSTFTVAQLRAADDAARLSRRTGFSVLLSEYSLVNRDAEQTLLPFCRERDIGFVPYFPLASGLLTGKYTRGAPAPAGTRLALWDRPIPAAHWDAAEKARRFALQRGRSVLELAMSALLAQPGVATVLAGATRPEQIRQNAAAAGWSLSADDLRDLDSALA